jgi:hypothetical protein
MPFFHVFFEKVFVEPLMGMVGRFNSLPPIDCVQRALHQDQNLTDINHDSFYPLEKCILDFCWLGDFSFLYALGATTVNAPASSASGTESNIEYL